MTSNIFLIELLLIGLLLVCNLQYIDILKDQKLGP